MSRLRNIESKSKLKEERRNYVGIFYITAFIAAFGAGAANKMMPRSWAKEQNPINSISMFLLTVPIKVSDL